MPCMLPLKRYFGRAYQDYTEQNARDVDLAARVAQIQSQVDRLRKQLDSDLQSDRDEVWSVFEETLDIADKQAWQISARNDALAIAHAEQEAHEAEHHHP